MGRELVSPLGARILVVTCVLIWSAVSGAASAADSLALRMEGKLGALPPPDGAAGAEASLPPVALGTTSLRYRVEGSRLESERWKETNANLAEHLKAREKHIQSLRSLVERQDQAISALKAQAENLKQSRAGSPPGDVVSRTAPLSPAAPRVETPFGSITLQSPYLLGGLVAVIVILLTWGLHLRSRIRDHSREAGLSPQPIASMAGQDSSSAGTPGKAGRVAATEKDVVALFQDYDRAAAALITLVGAAPVAKEHRLRLMRVLSAVSKKDEFLAEARALAEKTDDAESSRWLEEMGTADAPASPPASEPAPASREESASPASPAVSGPEEGTASTQREVPSADVARSAASPPLAKAGGGEPARRRPANISALKEIDTLIAFENYEQASTLLNQLLDEAPDNPEYRLRLLHILSAGGDTEASAEQEEILATMMEGPLSETLGRVRRMGRDLLPGHPLFNETTGDRSGDQTPPSGGKDDLFGALSAASPVGPATSDFDPLAVAEEPGIEHPDEEQPDEAIEEFVKSAFEPTAEASDAATEVEAGGGLDLDLEPHHFEASPAQADAEDGMMAIDLSDSDFEGLEDEELPPIEFELSDDEIIPVEGALESPPAASDAGKVEPPAEDDPEREFGLAVFDLTEGDEHAEKKKA